MILIGIYIVQQSDKAFSILYESTQNIIIISFVIIIIISIIAFKFSNIITKPIFNLIKGINIISNGNIDYTVSVNSNDEIELLANNFNEMTKKLNKNKNEIEGLKIFLEDIIDSMPSIIIVIDDSKNILLWNKHATIVSNKMKMEVINKKLYSIIPNIEKFDKKINDTIQSRKEHFALKEFDIFLKDKYQNISFFPVTTIRTNDIVIRIDDIDDEVKTDESMKQMQKMESVGNLAAGIAHDFNNILGSIIGTISLIEFKIQENAISSPNELLEDITLLKESSNRAKKLIKQLLSISRKAEPSFTTISLNDILNLTINMCRNSFDKSISINFDENTLNAYLYGDEALLEQVFLNIFLNASHAMTIMRKNKNQIGGVLNISLSEDKNYYCVKTQDNGVGIPEDELNKIFNPFFTTKNKEHGTGLGLSTTLKIIKEHNGDISVKSKINVGTTFIVKLPKTNKALSSNIESTKDRLLNINKSILIIDDEKQIREIASQLFQKLGFKVSIAKNGLDGIEMYKKNRQDYVLIDLIMPKLSGDKVFEELQKVNSKVQVIFSSGFGNDDRILKALENGAIGFIPKPYTLDELNKRLINILKKD